MGDVFQDSRVLEQASEAAGRILEDDAELALPKHEKLKGKSHGQRWGELKSVMTKSDSV